MTRTMPATPAENVARVPASRAIDDLALSDAQGALLAGLAAPAAFATTDVKGRGALYDGQSVTPTPVDGDDLAQLESLGLTERRRFEGDIDVHLLTARGRRLARAFAGPTAAADIPAIDEWQAPEELGPYDPADAAGYVPPAPTVWTDVLHIDFADGTRFRITGFERDGALIGAEAEHLHRNSKRIQIWAICDNAIGAYAPLFRRFADHMAEEMVDVAIAGMADLWRAALREHGIAASLRARLDSFTRVETLAAVDIYTSEAQEAALFAHALATRT